MWAESIKHSYQEFFNSGTTKDFFPSFQIYKLLPIVSWNSFKSVFLNIHMYLVFPFVEILTEVLTS